MNYIEKAEKRVEAIRRKTALRKWFGGAEPYSGEEEALAQSIIGRDRILVKKRIALHRRSQFLKIITSENPLNEQEQQIANQFTGPNSELLSGVALQIHRKKLLRAFISGEDVDITID